MRENCVEDVFRKLESCAFSYKTELEMRQLVAGEGWRIVFEAIDGVAEVKVNGAAVGTADNAFRRWEWAVGHVLKEGSNIVEVNFASWRSVLHARRAHDYQEWNDPVGGISRIRTPQFKAGWDWGVRLLTSGILGNVKMEKDRVKITRVEVKQDHARFEECGVVRVGIVVEVKCSVGCAGRSKEVLGGGGKGRFLAGGGVGCVARVDGGGAVMREVLGTCGWERGGEGDAKGETAVLKFKGEVDVQGAKLWWPNGYGEQCLYKVRVEVVGQAGVVMDERVETVGLRTVEVRRRRDGSGGMEKYWGTGVEKEEGEKEKEEESFMFVVNGRPIFAKGANFIPAQALLSDCSFEDYVQLTGAAIRAGFNMLRVWGGGTYEADMFFDLCDERGLLVWHDFMFSCSLYPGGKDFLQSCRKEAEFQVARLRNRPCMALWCGAFLVFLLGAMAFLNGAVCAPVCRVTSDRLSLVGLCGGFSFLQVIMSLNRRAQIL